MLPVASPRAEFVQAPVTAALACFVPSCASRPERHIPLMHPELKARIVPKMMDWWVVIGRLVSKSPPPRRRRGCVRGVVAVVVRNGGGFGWFVNAGFVWGARGISRCSRCCRCALIDVVGVAE